MTRLAFYDLDGTLVSTNVVTRYAFFARNHPSAVRAVLKYSKLILSIPLLIGLDHYSRRRFNEYFYRKYRGMKKTWLEGLAGQLFEEVVRPSIYPGARNLVEADRRDGFRLVLVTGGLDFDMVPVMRYFGFDDLIANSLEWANGAATGRVVTPIIAEEGKQAALRRVCTKYNVDTAGSKAYSDSYSDLPMLESVGCPAAVNPDRRLCRVALARGWPILNLKRPNGDTSSVGT
jgi:HAD superfamily hydrolase (TIGR01490 family)